jgi:hypothetical protein
MRLICFGDSWTAGHGIEEDVQYKEIPFPNMFVQKLRVMNSWPRWVAEKLECLYINLGVCGFGNEFILNEIKSVKKDGHFKKDDIIIVMLSYPYRYTGDTYNVIEIYEQMEQELNGLNHFYFNSFFPTFKEEHFDTSKLPDYFINPDGCVSNILREYEIKNDIGVWEYGSRSVWNDEKNFYEGDYHPNLIGYKIIGNHIYNEISKHGK